MEYPVILFDERIPFLAERLAAALPPESVRPINPDLIDRDAVKDADALLVRTRTRCNASLLEGSRVKVVVTGTIGTDHIDLDWCRTAGIKAVNSAGCNAPAVMQYVASTLSRCGIDPKMHTLGVVGKGNIGSLVAALYRGAGGKVLVSDPPRKLAGHTDEEYLPLEEVLRRSDAVTLHVPYEKGTHHLIGPKETEMFREGAVLVNASRGGVVDETSLLENRKDITLIVDTWEGEPQISRATLEKANIATMHIAGYSLEGKQRATRTMIETLNREFGLDISAEGLADYDYAANLLSWEETAASYNPLADDALLRPEPERFEELRDNYALRHEALKKI